jgi:dsDNA-specific endonuclease/ATPase MutS2
MNRYKKLIENLDYEKHYLKEIDRILQELFTIVNQASNDYSKEKTVDKESFDEIKTYTISSLNNCISRIKMK